MKCTADNYTMEVIKLFKSGKATDKQYAEMAHAVLDASENDFSSTWEIDDSLCEVFPELLERDKGEDYPAHDC